MEEKNLLPVGTVVMLEGGSKRVMIICFCSVEKNSKDIYDYSGCLYPEGLLSSDEICLFNHSQIEKIYHTGLIDEEETTFKEDLYKAIKEIKEKVENTEEW